MIVLGCSAGYALSLVAAAMPWMPLKLGMAVYACRANILMPAHDVARQTAH